MADISNEPKLSEGNGPSPATEQPMDGFAQVGFLSALVDAENIEIGDYTYYDDPDGPEHFVAKCVHYHFPFIGDRLIIGKFCALASGVRFFMNGGNHDLHGLTTYPFAIFGNGWEDPDVDWQAGSRGNTTIGNDVWIGNGATILPGVTVGDGAVIGAASVVGSDVPAYGVAVGNPARVVKYRFDEATITRLLAVQWWHWPAAKITANLKALRSGDIQMLEAAK